jgi:transcriptional regulator with XRE-family HTH domain
MEFEKKLFELRKQKGISQEELADKLNISRQTLSKWESGNSTPDMEKLILLSDYFEISLDELVCGNKLETHNESLKEGITIAKVLDDKILTVENKQKTKKGFKIVLIILAIFLGIDILSMVIYFLFWGLPK